MVMFQLLLTMTHAATIKVLNANIYGLPSSQVLNLQEFRFLRMGEAICNMNDTDQPDVMVFQEMNSAFYGKTKGWNGKTYAFPPDEHINNKFRQIIADCGYKYQFYYNDIDQEDFGDRKCQLKRECENGWETKVEDWSKGCGILGFATCKFCCNPKESAYSNHGSNLAGDIDTAMLGLKGKKLFRGGIMIASKWKLLKQEYHAFQEFSGVWEIDSVFTTDPYFSQFVDNVKSSIGQMAEKGVAMVEIMKDEQKCKIFGTHLNAYNTRHAMEERKAQLEELKKFVEDNSKKNECVILAADMNIDHFGPESKIFSGYLNIDPENYPPEDYYTVHGYKNDTEMYNPIADAETTKTTGFYDNEDVRKRYYDYIFSLEKKPSNVTLQRVIFRSSKPYVFLDKRKDPQNSKSFQSDDYLPEEDAKRVYKDGLKLDFLTDHDSVLATFEFDGNCDKTKYNWKKEFLDVFSNKYTWKSDKNNYKFDHENDEKLKLLVEGTKYKSGVELLNPEEEDDMVDEIVKRRSL